MQERSVAHSTFVIERIYSASPERVFSAFSDPAKKRRWFAEGEGLKIESFTMDFRVGGREQVCFRLPDGPPCRNDTVYQHILPGRHIVIAYTMTLGDQCISSSQASFEFVLAKDGTNLIFTEQAAFFEGADGPQMREAGWRKLLEQLAEEMAR
jgi:uncharacterized protein YndB with AHSA1/START domain